MAGCLSGATVLVTGAAGSVGAELCARLSGLDVRELVLVDAAEQALVDLARGLWLDHRFDAATPVLADVRKAARVEAVFDRHRPTVVFHAAAYKQVPLLELHPVEAVSTNVLGTRAVVDAARAAGVERFVLFSSDKAVHPTSILGRTKAVAEWITAGAGYSAIRLVNVVDSAGSILPLFRRQAALGGPVTVTHPEATRYLMSMADAAELALAAAELGTEPGIFWLDCGPPVRIADVARAVAGTAPIEFVGLRPGDRLHERLSWVDEQSTPTAREGIYRAPPRRVDGAWLAYWLDVLAHHLDAASEDGVRAALAEMESARPYARTV